MQEVAGASLLSQSQQEEIKAENCPIERQRAILWELLLENQQKEFRTMKGFVFTYCIRGGEMFVSRKAKSITKASVFKAWENAMKIQAGGEAVSGPREMGAFGSAYLFAIFKALGLLRSEEETGKTLLIL